MCGEENCGNKGWYERVSISLCNIQFVNQSQHSAYWVYMTWLFLYFAHHNVCTYVGIWKKKQVGHDIFTTIFKLNIIGYWIYIYMNNAAMGGIYLYKYLYGFCILWYVMTITEIVWANITFNFFFHFLAV